MSTDTQADVNRVAKNAATIVRLIDELELTADDVVSLSNYGHSKPDMHLEPSAFVEAREHFGNPPIQYLGETAGNNQPRFYHDGVEFSCCLDKRERIQFPELVGGTGA